MRFERATLIYNPMSGRRRRARERLVEGARKTLLRWIPRVDAVATQGPGDATRLARQAVADGADLICACGGDGTNNEALAGMAGASVPLLALPAGTANVLAEETGLEMDAEGTAAMLPGLAPYAVRLGTVHYQKPEPGSRYFLLMCGTGVDASIVYHLDASLKQRLGQGAYFLGSLEQLQRPFEPFLIRAGGRQYEGTFALASKSRRYGGKLVVTPGAHLLSDQFQVTIFHSDSPLRYVGYLAQVATQTLDRLPGVTLLHADRVEIEPIAGKEVHIEVDGELAGRIPAVVEMAPETVTLLLPPAYARRREEAAGLASSSLPAGGDG